ncbi:toll/interleukin-1 receptor-like protein isoform X2 [Eucalyptus grandis]|uniref:toll/interleukin-1 receptor-like protein isoform X2 n=1 Tax=Eucalyptus grandis TaxID=71139 RepID=UPI00192E84F0|nr:toll/interleukin-1 receptor-like protein isoform X2 [Eucalyptus grandis]XP_039163444.1 toll/interleukin-1 receptor-like protein isoform X2 [Eucalyptus grandis]
MDCTSLGLLFSNFSPFSLTDLLWNLHQDQQNYASSRCCLGELLEMMECKISRGHLVLPILYKVEPEDVELLLVMLAKRFCLREKHVDEKVEDQWEEVLIEIRSLKGWDSKKDVNRGLKRFETKAENKVGQIVYQDGGVTLFVSHIF